MWNSARKRKENEYSRARHGPLSPRWKTARDIKKRKSRGGGTCCVVGRAPFTACFSTWAGVNYLDVVCARACVQAGEENACDHYET